MLLLHCYRGAESQIQNPDCYAARLLLVVVIPAPVIKPLKSLFCADIFPGFILGKSVSL